ncbi:hypothetical protein MTO96_036588, partial [Rhipicephalus appendiculatus]
MRQADLTHDNLPEEERNEPPADVNEGRAQQQDDAEYFVTDSTAEFAVCACIHRFHPVSHAGPCSKEDGYAEALVRNVARRAVSIDSSSATSPADSVLVAASNQGCPSDQIDSSSASCPADSVLMAASSQGCPSDQIDSSSVSCPADSVLVAASSQGCPSDEIDSSSASCPADSVLVAASSQGCPSDQIDSSSVSCPADSVLVAASSQGYLSDEIDSSSATSPADSVLVAASNQGRPSDQAAHLMVTKFATTSHPLGTCFRETSATASRSAATHEPLSVTSQQVSPRKKVVDLQRKVKRLQRKNRDLLQENARIKKGITRVFTEDQVRALGKEKNTGCAWSAATIKNALRLHFACGSTGYNLLISQ